MGRSRGRVALALFSLLCTIGTMPAADDPPSPRHSAQEQTSDTKGQKKSAARETESGDSGSPSIPVPRVSTDDAVQSAAREVSKKPVLEDASYAPQEPAVLEFQAASPKSPAAGDPMLAPSSQGTEPEKDLKKSPLKTIHGSAYGALDARASGNRQAGASAGVASKSGKIHIDVATDSSRATETSRQ